MIFVNFLPHRVTIKFAYTITYLLSMIKKNRQNLLIIINYLYLTVDKFKFLWRLMMIKRNDVLTSLIETLKPISFIHGLIEGGATSFDRVDEWSDIDLGLVADDDKLLDSIEFIDQALEKVSPIDVKYKIPQPTWHGNEQIFYRLKNASKYLLIDLVLVKLSEVDDPMPIEIHGHPVVHFDKTHRISLTHLNKEDFFKQVMNHLNESKIKFDLFEIQVSKELNRNNDIEALANYYQFILRPLLAVIKIRYYPQHYDFHTRYVYYDLPIDVVKEIENLYFVATPDELRSKFSLAVQMYNETVSWIEANKNFLDFSPNNS